MRKALTVATRFWYHHEMVANFLTYRSLGSEQKAQFYQQLSKEERKELEEQEVFFSFAEAANSCFDPLTVRSEKPRKPDISCRVKGMPYLFELGEIAGQGLARAHSEALRTGKITGGPFSQDEPLIRMFREKARKTYQTDGAALDLILYFSKQYPFLRGIREFATKNKPQLRSLLADSPFSRIWIYDTWESRVLLRLDRSTLARTSGTSAIARP